MWAMRTRLSPSELLRAGRHVAAWVDYQTGGGTATSMRPAKLTYYAS
jgi:hypothetical protein